MATSGNVAFNMTALEVIHGAFSKLGVKASEQALQAEEIQDGLTSLNMMLKAWSAQGLHLWTKDEGILFLDVGKTDYLLGTGGDESCQFDDFISTTTTSAEATSATIFTVASTTGMVALDKVGIELDDGTRHWTTLKSVDSATQFTLTTGITSAAASGVSVYTFTNLVERPQRILSFRRKRFGEDNEIKVPSWSRQQYFNQVNKQSQGTTVNCYYSPQLTNGRLYVWQTASSVKDQVRFTFERQIEDITFTTDNLDLPTEWLEAIVYNLADRLADDYDVPAGKDQTISVKAEGFLDDLLGWDEEMESLNLQPDFD